jgi:hypothetical protein
MKRMNKIVIILMVFCLLLPAMVNNTIAPGQEAQSEPGNDSEEQVGPVNSRARDLNIEEFTDFSKGTQTNTREDPNGDLALTWDTPMSPYGKDGDTALLSHFENTLDGEDDEVPTSYTRSMNGLVGDWSLDDGLGSTAYDSSGNANHGNLLNGPTWTTDAISGKALDLDGVNDLVDVGNGASLNINTEITIEGWIKVNTATTWCSLFSKSGAYHFSSGTGTNFWRFAVYIGGERYLDSSSITLNEWYYLVGTYDGSFLRVYINGEFDKQKAQTGTFTQTANNAYIGALWGSTSWTLDGNIDEVAIYGRAKSSEEIKGDYDNYLASNVKFTNGKFGKGLKIDENSTFGYPVGVTPDANCVGLWRFNEGTGTSARDQSFNNNNGFLANGTKWVDGKSGKGVEFDGTDDTVELNYIPDTFNQHDHSISAWIKTGRDTGSNVIFGVGEVNAVNRVLEFKISSREVQIWHWGSNWYTAQYVDKDKWYHLVYTYDSPTATAKLYVNGEYRGSYTYSGDLLIQTDNYLPSQIGRGISGRLFQGVIDEVAIHNRVRTADEAYHDYLAGAQRNFDTQQGTLEMYVKPDWNGNDGENHTIFFSGNSSTNNSFFIYKSDTNKLIFKTSDNMSNSNNNPSMGVSSWVKNTWYHLAFTWDGSGAKEIYIDGHLRASVANSKMPNRTFSKIYIGTSPEAFYDINGTIDELRISSVVRSPDDFRDYKAMGTYESPIIDATETVSWERIAWGEVINPGTDIFLQTRFSQDNITWTNWTGSALGPSGEKYYVEHAEELINAERSRYIQWRALLSSIDGKFTPILEHVNITWNYLPKASNISLTPVSPTVLDDLVINYTYSDADNDPEDDTRFEWYVDRGVGFVDSGVRTQTLSADWTLLDDYWRCMIIPHDGKTSGLAYESAMVQISVGPIAKIEVTPENITITTDDDATFSARAYDSEGNMIATSFQWNATGGGELDQTGHFVPALAGVHGIAASAGGIVGHAVVKVLPGALSKVMIFPDNPEITADEIIQFEGVILDAKDNHIPGLVRNWSVSGGGIMNQDTGLFEAENPGTWIVTVKVGGITETTQVTIVPGKIDSIELVSQDANVTTDGTYQFVVIGFDADGNVVPVHTNWEVDNGMISGDGLFVPDDEGTWNVTVTVPGTALSIRTTIIVNRGTISELILDPSVHVMKVNETQKFTVTAMDSVGNEWPVSSDITWDVSNPSAGFFTGEGVFNAKKPGKVTVTATVSLSTSTNDSNTSGNGENVIGSAQVTIIEDYDSLPPDGKTGDVKKEKDEGANMGLVILLIILIIIIVVLLFVFMKSKGAEEREAPARRKREEREPEEEREEPEEEEEWEEESEEEPEPEEEPGGWEVVDEEEDEEYDEDLEDIDVEDEPEEKAVPAKGKMPIKGKMPKKGKMPEDDEDFWE